MSKPYKLDVLVARELLELAYHTHGEGSFQPCGSNGGDLVHYCYTTGVVKIFFSNHGYIKLYGLDIDLDSIKVTTIV